jgi:2-polyprenyl-6-methoxyphenol hydroxylase-like FAD-dependent oxidoreductase
VTATRSVIVAGAGIGGLTAALALARNGFRVAVLEQAERLSETGAGIQLSPNATRCLIELGLGERLRPHVTEPSALRVLVGHSGREIVRMPLGGARERHGAPYWIIHRGDLQAALVAAAAEERDISLKLGMRVEDFATHSNGVTVSANSAAGVWHERGHALIAADGLWSESRARLGFKERPRFAGRTAWRALIPASEVPPEWREPSVHLWLGRDAHLVHYPVKAGAVINIVAITTDAWNAPGWSAPASRVDLLPRFPAERWAAGVRALIREPETWLKWALYDCPPLPGFSYGAAALIGDAAHPMLPFVAQGAAMAIEDAMVAAHSLARMPDDAAGALKFYSALRRRRTRKVQRVAAKNGARYHLRALPAIMRNAAMRALGGARLLRHYDWLYDWRPPAAPSSDAVE